MIKPRSPHTAQTVGVWSEPNGRDSMALPDGRDKGKKSPDNFEVWHHHGQVRRPGEWDLLQRFDQRR